MFKDNIAPFFWLHGEELSVLKTELDKVEESGISAICVESRPHPDFAGEKWWLDMDLLVGEAKKRGMKLWLLDDCRFPTGFANGAFAERASDKANLFLTIHVRDAVGPLTGGVILLDSILKNAEEIVAVTAYRRADLDSTELSEESFDLTDKIVNGCIRWDVPEGLWRVCTAYTTHKGVGRKDYFNILDSSSVRVLLDEVYEPHYKRYGAEFGKTFMGFFSDEPEFANVSGYDFQARLGEKMRFIPWSGELEARLKTAWGEAFPSMLPLLWYNSASLSRHARYDFMQAVTRQLQVSFSAQVAGWCEEHGVSHIGHIIEDDNVHARLGCSTGHYFRSLSGMRMAGIDVVLLQIMPGFTGTIHQWVASDRDGEFFHFGLAKLCASLAHIDPKKRGDALCEIFGAYNLTSISKEF